MEPRAVPAVNGAVPLVNLNPFTEAIGPQLVRVDSSIPTVKTVDLVDPNGAPLLPESAPFPGFTGSITAVAGDVNGDGKPDLIAAAQNAGGTVAVFDGATGALLGEAPVFPGFNGQVSVGVAELSGNGYADILVAAAAPGLPVRAFDLRQGALVAAFDALPGFSGPVSVAGTDLAGTGKDQILVGTTIPGLGAAAGAFNTSGTLLTGVLAFPGYPGPISVAGGDVNGDGFGDIIVGTGGAPASGRVNVFSGRDGSLLLSFPTIDGNQQNGILVATGTSNADGDGQPDVLVADPTDPGQSVTAYDGATGAQLTNFPPFDDGFQPG
jgi:hypothetical protein